MEPLHQIPAHLSTSLQPGYVFGFRMLSRELLYLLVVVLAGVVLDPAGGCMLMCPFSLMFSFMRKVPRLLNTWEPPLDTR